MAKKQSETKSVGEVKSKNTEGECKLASGGNFGATVEGSFLLL